MKESGVHWELMAHSGAAVGLAQWGLAWAGAYLVGMALARRLAEERHQQAGKGGHDGDKPLPLPAAEIERAVAELGEGRALIVAAHHADGVVRAFEARRDVPPPPPVADPGQHRA